MRCVHCHTELHSVQARCPSCSEDPRLEGRYLLEAVIGEGAAATLYRARDLQQERHVAIKERHPRGMISAQEEQLFARETRVLQQLDHPQIPRYLDAFTSGVGRARRHYLVQELVDGRSLDQELSTTRLDERAVLGIVREVAAILVYLHGLTPPVVHRDLKPSNLMRRRDGSLVLVDFGAVRDTLAGTLGGSTVAGTFGFMAPEQFMGDAPPAADVFGLGATAVALLTRRDPATMLDTQRRFHWRKAVSVSDGVMALLHDLLAEGPEDRPTANQVLARTETLLRGQDASARTSGAPLGEVAARGAVVRAREHERERDEAAREADRATALRTKRLQEGVVGPVLGWLFRHQASLQSQASVLGAFTLIGLHYVGLNLFVSRVPLPDALVAVLGLVGTGVALAAGMLLPLYFEDRVLACIAGAAHRRELDWLEQLDLPLRLGPYLGTMAELHSDAQACIAVDVEREVDAAVVQHLEDALLGLGLEGTVTRGDHDRQLVIRSPALRLTTLHGKHLTSVLSHHSRAHAWVRQVLRQVVLPYAKAAPVRAVRPELRER